MQKFQVNFNFKLWPNYEIMEFKYEAGDNAK